MDLQIRLSNLHEATEQQVFDQAALHLLTQNRKSMTGSKCAYRTKGGLKCAAGCFISEDEYEKEGLIGFEGRSWPTLVRGEKVPSNHQYLIRLQTVHDASEVYEWTDALAILARRSNLSDKVVREFMKSKEGKEG